MAFGPRKGQGAPRVSRDVRPPSAEPSDAVGVKLRASTTVVLGLGALLLVIGVRLALDNPAIDRTDVGTYQCFAPYDTVLFGSRNDVGACERPGQRGPLLLSEPGPLRLGLPDRGSWRCFRGCGGGRNQPRTAGALTA